MHVNRSGYYKWCKRKGSQNIYEKNRDILTQFIYKVHAEHRSYGYHAIATSIRESTGWIISDNLVHKCCKHAHIRSCAKHYRYKKKSQGEENIMYKNIIHGNWNAKKPTQIIVSDMTCIRHNGVLYEWTYLLDTFNNEIISSYISGVPGDRRPYFRCLEDLKQLIKEQKDPVVLHTDQGSVYSSRAFSNAHKDYNIIRSMSRAGTPTDNPIIEAINGWIKCEIAVDFKKKYVNRSVFEMIKDYVKYYNNYRPAYALKYKSPVQYRIEQGFV